MKKIAIENYSRYIDFLKKKKINLSLTSLIYFFVHGQKRWDPFICREKFLKYQI